MIDSHCHLDGASFDADREAVLERARAAGVTDVVVPGVEPAGWEPLLRLAAGRPGVHAALGIHRGQVVVGHQHARSLRDQPPTNTSSNVDS